MTDKELTIIERGTWKPVGVVDGVIHKEMDIPEKVINERAKQNSNVYLSDFLDILPSGMFMKGATGIGGTTLILESDQPCIVAFPTRNLTINKMVERDPVTHKITAQRTDFFCIYGGHNDKISDLERYLKENGSKPVKICCTYDQTFQLVENLKSLGNDPRRMGTYELKDENGNIIEKRRGLQLVIDEWHQILFDYSGKRIKRLRKMLSLINDPMFEGRVTCMSATPLTRKFLFKEMQTLPCYTVNYKPVFPEIIQSRHKSLNHDLRDLVKSFLSGAEGTANAHIFLNSVSSIKSVVFDPDIAPHLDRIKIVISEQDENEKTISTGAKEYISWQRKRWIAGEINETEFHVLTGAAQQRVIDENFPDRKPVDSINDDVRKINFYTATAFCGCDIYDENAIQYVISDGAKRNTMQDISTIFIQILGRIRDARNPQVYYWFSQNRYLLDEKGQCEYFDDKEYRMDMAKTHLKHQDAAIRTFKKKNNWEELDLCYLRLNDDEDGLVFDQNLVIKDEFNFENVQHKHRSAVSVKAEFLKSGFKVKETISDDYNKTLGREIAKRPTIKTTFKQRFEFYVRLRTDPQLDLFQQRPFDIYTMESDDELLKPAFDIVGVEKVRALKYSQRAIRSEIESFRTGQAKRRAISAFGLHVGDVIQTKKVKELEKKAAKKLGVDKVKLTDYFEKSNPIKVTIKGERVNCYRILAIKGKKKT